MAKIQVSQPINTNDEQSLYTENLMLYTELSSTETENLNEGHVLSFPESEIENKYTLTEESGKPTASNSEESFSPALRQTQRAENNVVVSQYRARQVRRCGGLSDF
ncbi:hypothetical protein [Allocoleopsis franciscana]|uniref:Uncharacterized protein n=1 Tax=Allocoleopsis franciscana PCC 7113 TaxID=1173027 RepID=K9WKP6_9CYAN|nr:hypothetical protein [Allocoleopsis franciscana]AFZ20391.1 hypothetical protein Mic7113_4718 [Allocoleopsis franciscana PCC 7113]